MNWFPLVVFSLLCNVCLAVEPAVKPGDYLGVVKTTKRIGTISVSSTVTAKAMVSPFGHIYILTAPTQSPSSLITNPQDGVIALEFLPEGAFNISPNPSLPAGSYRLAGTPIGAAATVKGSALTISYQSIQSRDRQA